MIVGLEYANAEHENSDQPMVCVDHGGPFSTAAHSKNHGKIQRLPKIVADRTSYFVV
jgi:hypothetical protein